MATVTYCNRSFECETAIKGEDYVHLLDADGVMFVAFDGVTDFSGFAITGGAWKTPTADHNCRLAVIKDDGTIGKGNHKCSDIPTKLGDLKDVVICTETPTDLVEGRWYLIRSEV